MANNNNNEPNNAQNNGNNKGKRGPAIHINIVNFDEEANLVINDAIELSGEASCANVNSAHLFMALLRGTLVGNNMLKEADTTFEEVYDKYTQLVKDGVFGYFDSSQIPFEMQFFAPELMMMFTESVSRMAFQNQTVSTFTLWNELLSMQLDDLHRFMHEVGVPPEVVENVFFGDFWIPEELENFVEDMGEKMLNNPQAISGVDKYVDEMIEVLSRKMKANPCLVGEAGVGKTTIVKALVQRILAEEVPEELADSHIIYTNSSLLTSGTRFRGDFEERMKILIDWASKQNVILFLDEIQTFIDLGKSSSSADTAGNMVKTALADGSIRIIGTTTLQEYHKYIEKDKAFDRRMQKIEVKEPSIEDAIAMITDTVNDYEEFHKTKVPSVIIEKAVKLSDRYMKDKFLPDKAYTVIDQACARTKLDHRKTVKETDLLAVISKITSIDINKIGDKEAQQLLKLENTIKKNVIGQEQAIKTVAKAIRRSKAGVRETNKPIASFLFVGPTGVGKTELSKVLSKEVASGDESFIKIDMSEYSEKHSISKLIGTAPGYVGYEEGGQLTEKVKHNPYSIVLFDEIEKAHPEIFNTFLQLLDEGHLTDGEGAKVDFTNTIIIMTSNAGYGADGMNKLKLGFNSNNKALSANENEKVARKALEETFRPEFINRIDNIVIFEKLTKEQCKDITKLLLDKLSKRVAEQDIHLDFDKSVIDMITETGYSEVYGARNLRREIQDNIEDVISDAILGKKLKAGSMATVVYKDNNVEIETELLKKETVKLEKKDNVKTIDITKEMSKKPLVTISKK